MLIKICGLTRLEDVALAAKLGADYLGFVMAADSPRNITPEFLRQGVLVARRVARGRVEIALVVRGVPIEEIEAIALSTPIDLLQVHGSPKRDVASLRERGLEVLVSHDLHRGGLDASTLDSDERLHLDGGRGGEGRRLDFEKLPKGVLTRSLVAGGLTPADLPRLARLKVLGVDLNSGVERSPGLKDQRLLEETFAARSLIPSEVLRP